MLYLTAADMYIGVIADRGVRLSHNQSTQHDAESKLRVRKLRYTRTQYIIRRNCSPEGSLVATVDVVGGHNFRVRPHRGQENHVAQDVRERHELAGYIKADDIRRAAHGALVRGHLVHLGICLSIISISPLPCKT